MMFIKKNPFMAASLNIALTMLPLALLISGAAAADEDLPISQLQSFVNLRKSVNQPDQSPSHQQFGIEVCYTVSGSCSRAMEIVVGTCIDPRTQIPDEETFICMCTAIEELSWTTFWDEFQVCQKCLREQRPDIDPGVIVDWSEEGPRLCKRLIGGFVDVTPTTTRPTPTRFTPLTEPTDSDTQDPTTTETIDKDSSTTTNLISYVDITTVVTRRITSTVDITDFYTPSPTTSDNRTPPSETTPAPPEDTPNENTGAGSILRLGSAEDGGQAAFWTFIFKIGVVAGMGFML